MHLSRFSTSEENEHGSWRRCLTDQPPARPDAASMVCCQSTALVGDTRQLPIPPPMALPVHQQLSCPIPRSCTPPWDWTTGRLHAATSRPARPSHWASRCDCPATCIFRLSGWGVCQAWAAARAASEVPRARENACKPFKSRAPSPPNRSWAACDRATVGGLS
jgi:hypothetical protein